MTTLGVGMTTLGVETTTLGVETTTLGVETTTLAELGSEDSPSVGEFRLALGERRLYGVCGVPRRARRFEFLRGGVPRRRRVFRVAIHLFPRASHLLPRGVNRRLALRRFAFPRARGVQRLLRRARARLRVGFHRVHLRRGRLQRASRAFHFERRRRQSFAFLLQRRLAAAKLSFARRRRVLLLRDDSFALSQTRVGRIPSVAHRVRLGFRRRRGGDAFVRLGGVRVYSSSPFLDVALLASNAFLRANRRRDARVRLRDAPLRLGHLRRHLVRRLSRLFSFASRGVGGGVRLVAFGANASFPIARNARSRSSTERRASSSARVLCASTDASAAATAASRRASSASFSRNVRVAARASRVSSSHLVVASAAAAERRSASARGVARGGQRDANLLRVATTRRLVRLLVAA